MLLVQEGMQDNLSKGISHKPWGVEDLIIDDMHASVTAFDYITKLEHNYIMPHTLHFPDMPT